MIGTQSLSQRILWSESIFYPLVYVPPVMVDLDTGSTFAVLFPLISTCIFIININSLLMNTYCKVPLPHPPSLRNNHRRPVTRNRCTRHINQRNIRTVRPLRNNLMELNTSMFQKRDIPFPIPPEPLMGSSNLHHASTLRKSSRERVIGLRPRI